MADRVIVVEVEYDTEQAQQSIKDLSATIEGERVEQAKLKKALEEGRISQVEYSKKVAESKERLNQANRERKNTIQLTQQESNSINGLKAKIKDLTSKRDKLNLTTEEGRKKAEQYNREIEETKKRLKEAQTATEKSGGAFARLGQDLDKIPGPIGGIIQGIKSMTKAAMTFILTPIGAVIAALALAIMAVKKAFTASEEGQNKYNKLMSMIGVVTGNLSDLLSDLGEKIIEAFESPQEAIEKFGETLKKHVTNRIEGMLELIPALGKSIKLVFQREFKEAGRVALDAVSKATLGVENMTDRIQGLIEKTKEQIKENKRELAIAKNLADRRAALDKIEREATVTRAKNAKRIADLILLTRQENVANEEKKKALEEAMKIKSEELDLDMFIAKERLKLKQEENNFSKSTKEDLNEEAELRANVFTVEKQNADQRRELVNRQIELGNRIRAEEKKAEDERKKAQEEEIKRRGEAILKLAELEQARMEREAETFEEERDLKIEREQEEYNRLIENKQLLSEEIELIEAQHREKLTAIEQDYQTKVEAMRQKNLNQARSNMQAIIKESSIMADSRVTIMSDAFSKIATINYKEVDSFTDAANAMGSAASGLTDLIIANHGKEYADLQQQKAAQLKLAGDNAKMREEIERRYAKKEQELKKKQFEEDKKKAIIDASIATALAVLNGLTTQPFMPLGIAMAAVAGILGGVQIASISRKKYTPTATYAKGGIIGGLPHSQGGTKFYGDDGSIFEAEKNELMLVLNKDATAEIAAYSAINESYGGRSFFNKGSSHLQEGGNVRPEAGNIERQVDEAIQRTPIFVRVGDIETGMTEKENVKQAGVI